MRAIRSKNPCPICGGTMWTPCVGWTNDMDPVDQLQSSDRDSNHCIVDRHQGESSIDFCTECQTGITSHPSGL